MLWLLVSIALGGCPIAGVSQTPTSLREVDWCNRDYGLVWGALKDGRGEYHEWEADMSGHSTTITTLFGVYHADNAALVVIIDKTWLAGTGGFSGSTLLRFEWQPGGPVEVARASAPAFDRVTLVGDAIEGHWTWPGGESTARWVRQGKSFEMVVPELPKAPDKAPAPVP